MNTQIAPELFVRVNTCSDIDCQSVSSLTRLHEWARKAFDLPFPGERTQLMRGSWSATIACADTEGVAASFQG